MIRDKSFHPYVFSRESVCNIVHGAGWALNSVTASHHHINTQNSKQVNKNNNRTYNSSLIHTANVKLLQVKTFSLSECETCVCVCVSSYILCTMLYFVRACNLVSWHANHLLHGFSF